MRTRTCKHVQVKGTRARSLSHAHTHTRTRTRVCTRTHTLAQVPQRLKGHEGAILRYVSMCVHLHRTFTCTTYRSVYVYNMPYVYVYNIPYWRFLYDKNPEMVLREPLPRAVMLVQNRFHSFPVVFVPDPVPHRVAQSEFSGSMPPLRHILCITYA